MTFRFLFFVTALSISVLSVSLSEFGNFSFDGEIGNAHS